MNESKSRGETSSTSHGFGFCTKSSLEKKKSLNHFIFYTFSVNIKQYLTEKERSCIITPLTFVLMLLLDSNKYIFCSSKTTVILH